MAHSILHAMARRLVSRTRKAGRRLGRKSRPQLLVESLENRHLLAGLDVLIPAGDADALRAAITTANSNNADDVITLAGGTYSLAYNGPPPGMDDTNVAGDLDFTEAGHTVTLRGTGAGSTRIRGVDERALHVLPGVTVVVEGITIEHGSQYNPYSTSASAFAGGGGIYNQGDLTLRDSHVQTNLVRHSSLSDSGAGAGILNRGQLAVFGGTISGNSFQLQCFWGCPVNETNAGGGLANFGTAQLRDTTITGNTAKQGGGVYNAGTLSLQNVEIHGNTGGDLVNDGGTIVTGAGPTAAADAYAVAEDQALVVSAAAGVLANDSDPDGDPLTATVERLPNHGTLNLSLDGSFVYTPAPDFFGMDSFVYRAHDGAPESTQSTANVATVAIEVTPINDAPRVAGDGPYYVAPNGVLRIAAPGLLANDADPEQDPITTQVQVPPAHGNLTLNADGSFVYEPLAGFSGTDQFRYVATDGQAWSAAAKVTINVTTLIVTTTADEDDGRLGGGTGISLREAVRYAPPGVTIDLPAGTYLLSHPDGELEIAGRRVLRGASAATTIIDGRGLHRVYGTLATGERVLRVPGSGVVELVDLTLTGGRPLADVNGGPGGGAVLNLGELTIRDSRITGNTAVSWEHGEGGGIYNAGTLRIIDSVLTENRTAQRQQNCFSWSCSTFDLTAGRGGALYNAGDATLINTQITNNSAQENASIPGDGGGIFNTGVLRFSGSTIENNQPNNVAGGGEVIDLDKPLPVAPEAHDDHYSMAEDSFLSVGRTGGILANDQDANGDPLTAVLVSNPEQGSVLLSPDGSFEYWPIANFHGIDRFTYRASDGAKESAVATVTIDVTPVNDAPTAEGDAYIAAAGESLRVTASGVLRNDEDIDNQGLTAKLVQGPADGTLTLNPDGTFEYTPRPGFAGADRFTYRADDGLALSPVATVTLQVAPREPGALFVQLYDDLTGDDGLLSLSEALQIAEGDAQQSIIQLAPGTFSLNGSLRMTSPERTTLRGAGAAQTTIAGKIERALHVAASGTATLDQITVRGSGIFNAGSLHVVDSGVNDNSVWIGNHGGGIENSGVLTLERSTVTDNKLVAFCFSPSPCPDDGQGGGIWNSGSASLVDTVVTGNHAGRAGGGIYNSGTLRLTRTEITGNTVDDLHNAGGTVIVDTVPQAQDDTYAVDEDGTLTVSAEAGVLANDSDPDGDALTVALERGPRHGTLELTPSGAFIYTPARDFFGTDSFVYRALDGSQDALSATSNLATATITVRGVNDAPQATDDGPYYVAPDGRITVAAPGLLANDRDVEGDALTVQLVHGPVNGSLTLDTHGSFSYQPRPGFSGRDQFTYLASDGLASSLPAVVTIEVTTVTVTTTLDEDDGGLLGGTGVSLREAMRHAPAGIPIDLPAGTYRLTHPDGELDVTGHRIVRGTGAEVTVIDASGLKTTYSSVTTGERVLRIHPTGVMEMDGVTLTGGRPFGGGGAVFNEGQLTLRDSHVTANTAVSSGTTLGGGIYNSGTLLVTGSVISHNQVAQRRDSCYSWNCTTIDVVVGQGAGLYNRGQATLIDTQVIDNVAQEHDTLLGDGGGIYNTGTLTLSNSTVRQNVPNNIAGSGTVEDDSPLASGKFLVADDGADSTFLYASDGSPVGSYSLASSNQGSRGIASSPNGSVVLVLNADGNVFVYDDSGDPLGQWFAQGLSRPEGIATDGTHVWIVDRGTDRMYFFEGGLSRRSGSIGATYQFRLARDNGNPRGVTTDGMHLWVVNEGRADRVFRYTVSGQLEGKWTLDAQNSSPRGIAIDPSDVNHIWVVDASADRIFQYSQAAGRTWGSQLADAVMPLAAGNRNPQGLADPSRTAPENWKDQSAGLRETAARQLHSVDDVYDINRDGVLSPADVLAVINQLNRPRDLRPVAAEEYRTDVNNDRHVSPLDALAVINALQRQTSTLRNAVAASTAADYGNQHATLDLDGSVSDCLACDVARARANHGASPRHSFFASFV